MEIQKFEFLKKKVKLNFDLFLKSCDLLNFVNISPIVVIDSSRERSSQVATTTCKPENLNFCSKKVENEFCLVFLHCPESLNRLSFVNISSTLVNDT